MQMVSISHKLLTKVLTSFVILTFFVFIIQLVLGYFTVRYEIEQELKQLHSTINSSLSQAIWELNDNQLVAIGYSLSLMPTIKAIIIHDESAKVIYQGGQLLAQINQTNEQAPSSPTDTTSYDNGSLFGFTSTLSFNLANNAQLNTTYRVGSLSLYSSNTTVITRVITQAVIPTVGMMVGMALLIYLVNQLFKRLLTAPLEKLSQDISRLDLDKLHQSKLNVSSTQNDELSLLANSFNLMLVKLEEYQDHLKQTQQELIDANFQLDQQNLSLEQEVTRKTASLSQIISELAQQKEDLEQSKDELKASLMQLENTKDQLVESEKMASLGSLVAGIAHEINTPIGIGVTAVSYLADAIGELDHAVANKLLTNKHMTEFLKTAKDSSRLVVANLQKASKLIQSFKEVAVDQTSEAHRTIHLPAYLQEVIQSLQPILRPTQHKVIVNCDDVVAINCQAGSLAQIFTNLILNSLTHAFEGVNQGQIVFNISQTSDFITIDYHDTGNGISQKHLDSLFEPFFTTKRGQGGSGLGTHIVYNLVTQSLHGTIAAACEPGQGLSYSIQLPQTKPK